MAEKEYGQQSNTRDLVSILCEQQLVSLAEMLVKMSPKPRMCLLILAKYLRHFYIHDFPHPASNQWPSLLEGFDFPLIYVDLKLYKVPLNKTPGDSGSSTTEVELSEVLNFQEKRESRFVILFEGIAGSGKTTLSWHACREWADKAILQQFSLMIHVQVSDTRIQSASSLQDLIPDPDRGARDEIAQAIRDRNGKEVCLLFEGMDEASNSLRKFVLSKLLLDRTLTHLSIIITSRPDSRLLISLQKVLSLKIVINGFTSEKLDEFLDSAMQDDKGRNELHRMFEVSPRFQALCTLPINAVVVSFLVQCFGHDLPVTQTGLFKLLVCHICIRHAQLRDGDSDLEIQQLPYDLPSDLHESFDKLCFLAYTASMEKKKALSLRDLKQANFEETVNNKLGILQICQTKSMCGLSKTYSFSHLSLQQFLGAIHLSHHKNTEQIILVQVIVQQEPLDELLPLYAGLASDEIRTKIIECLDCSMSLDDESVASEIIKNPTKSNDPRRKFLAICKCLYEAQNEALIAKVDLKCGRIPNSSISLYPGQQFYQISLRNMWVSPLECLALGYFVRHKSITMQKYDELALGLGNTDISDTSFCVLTKELKRDIDYYTPGRTTICLEHNKLGYQALMSVKELLKGQSNIEGIALTQSFSSTAIDKKIVLKHITEGLHVNSSRIVLAMGYNGFNQSHIHHLILLIKSCPRLRSLQLSSFHLGDCTYLLSKALSLSTLHFLHLDYCGIDDAKLATLGEGICQNPFLKILDLSGNHTITLAGFIHFLSFFINEVSELDVINIDAQYVIYCQALNFEPEEIKQINKIRRQLNRYPLRINSRLLDPLTCNAVRGTLFLDTLASLSRKHQST